MRRAIIDLCQWALKRLRVFQPCIVLWEDATITEFCLKDAGTIYCPLPVGPGHCVDLGFDHDGKLVAVKIWADVTTRDKLEQLRAHT
jgi:hypothetical protein